LQKLEQYAVGVSISTNVVVREDVFTEIGAVECAGGAGDGVREPRRLRVGIGLECRVGDGATASPEAAAADLVRIGLPCNTVGQVRNAAGMLRSRPAREPGYGQVRCAPEIVHGTRLANEPCAELLEHAVDVHERCQYVVTDAASYELWTSS
jgi:hypothetical protein